MMSVQKYLHIFIRNFASKQTKLSSTICALASGSGRAGVSIIRVSGPKSLHLISKMTENKFIPTPRKAHLKKIRDPFDGNLIDMGLVLFFPGPNSFTGEDCCEFQVHGSPAVVNAVLTSLTKFDQVRIAEPGEFSKRAFYNNKLDLAQIEGLADLLTAETESQRKQAMHQLSGKLSGVYFDWRERLCREIAHLEADIDFSETEDISVNLFDVKARINKMKLSMDNYISDGEKARVVKNGIGVVIYGAPNVGKSSFFNALCKDQKAIVSSMPGTTRDVLEAKLDLGGFSVQLHDTAGFRNQVKDRVEGIGISKAVNSLNTTCGVHVLMISLPRYIFYRRKYPERRFISYLREYINSMGLNHLINEDVIDIDNFFKNQTIIVMNKTDLKKDFSLKGEEEIVSLISCADNRGVRQFIERLTNVINTKYSSVVDNPKITMMRQVHHLYDCSVCLELFLSSQTEDLSILVQHLRESLKHLGCITGKVVTEEILDVIFSEFCVGK